jgi:hypothetical protein
MATKRRARVREDTIHLSTARDVFEGRIGNSLTSVHALASAGARSDEIAAFPQLQPSAADPRCPLNVDTGQKIAAIFRTSDTVAPSRTMQYHKRGLIRA